MLKVNTNDLDELTWSSPGNKFGGAGKQVSEALGRDPRSTDLLQRHPFDIEIARIEPGKISCPYHSHSHQWEFYHVISGSGYVRHEGGTTPVTAGDAFLFKPGEAHAIGNDGETDLVMYVVADNPSNETCYYPDSRKWAMRMPDDRIMRAGSNESLDYYDGEE
ncbi:MAG: cupin domain-containing protein [Candidatus Eremiobacteraeota bacterium]|nr:cupin domain-containing protein [Candidatus Eremiobacteraeota bacterium]